MDAHGFRALMRSSTIDGEGTWPFLVVALCTWSYIIAMCL